VLLKVCDDFSAVDAEENVVALVGTDLSAVAGVVIATIVASAAVDAILARSGFGLLLGLLQDLLP